MNAEPKIRSQARPSGRRYGSVDDFMASEGMPKDIIEKVDKLRKDSRIALQLALLRQESGLTQEEMAARMGVTQSAISKLESGTDDELKLHEIAEYAKATKERICILFGKPMNHVESVKLHAFAIKKRLEELAKIANQDEELEVQIKAFFGEAFFNILSILAACGDKFASGPDFEVRMEVSKRQPSKGLVEPTMRKEAISA
jgi:transcriptional regulator with XRE-family HTH domain